MRKPEIEGFLLLSGGYTSKDDKGRMNFRSRIAGLLSLCAEARKRGGTWGRYDHACYMQKIGDAKKELEMKKPVDPTRKSGL